MWVLVIWDLSPEKSLVGFDDSIRNAANAMIAMTPMNNEAKEICRLALLMFTP